jgi:hypothetical protein
VVGDATEGEKQANLHNQPATAQMNFQMHIASKTVVKVTRDERREGKKVENEVKEILATAGEKRSEIASSACDGLAKLLNAQ